MNKKTILMILDGWGIGNQDASDAIHQASTPYIDQLMNQYASSTLITHGEDVGLPEGQMGNSEVGHLNIGAGRVVYQDLVRINKSISDNELGKNRVLTDAFSYAKENNKKLHFIGLVSNGGVHSSQKHLHTLLDLAKEADLKDVFVHAFTDGRDCSPTSGLSQMVDLVEHLDTTGYSLATTIGRYYSMDRDNRWERIQIAYDLLTQAKGKPCNDIIAEMQSSYDSGVTDEFLEAKVMVNQDGQPIASIAEGDVVICFNFRTDRCREISAALTQKSMPEYGMKTIDLRYITMTEYDQSFTGIEVLFRKDNLQNTLGEIVSKAGKSQIRIAETEKYPHVTFFFSGGREKPFDGENRLLAPSPKVATYDLQPEMNAQGIQDAIINSIQVDQPDFICLNFANPDMVGHTGVFDAIVKAVEYTDQCAQNVLNQAFKNGYSAIVIADHGNADFTKNADGSPNTAHTTNLVPVIVAAEGVNSIKSGRLADVAPTILHLMGIEQPVEMTGTSLIK